MLVNVPRLVTAYYTATPDASVPGQRVAFGTSGHRGSSFDKAFNEWHILAISQAICPYRAQQNIDGPLFLGMDTHALSVSALASALEVLAANVVEVMLTEGDEYTLKDRFEIAFACDTDHDRHGIVTRSAGLLPRNHYLLVAISYRFHSNTDR
jgi:phosphoglucomutase